MCRFRNRNYNIYNSALIENRKKLYNASTNEILRNDKYLSFTFERCREKKGYITKNNQNRTGYVLKEKYIYDVICKVEL